MDQRGRFNSVDRGGGGAAAIGTVINLARI